MFTHRSYDVTIFYVPFSGYLRILIIRYSVIEYFQKLSIYPLMHEIIDMFRKIMTYKLVYNKFSSFQKNLNLVDLYIYLIPLVNDTNCQTRHSFYLLLCHKNLFYIIYIFDQIMFIAELATISLHCIHVFEYDHYVIVIIY